MKIEKLKIKNQSGFTLSLSKGYTIIETMIAISIFLILVTIGMTSLLNAYSVHEKSQNMRGEMDNLSFIIEDMSRNLRTGSQFHCMEDLTFVNISNKRSSQNGENCLGIAFKPSDAEEDTNIYVYYISSDGAIYKSIGYNPPGFDPSNFNKLTPDIVKINAGSGFYVFGAENGDAKQPIVQIRLNGNVFDNGIASPFSLQTSVSQRLLDLDAILP